MSRGGGPLSRFCKTHVGKTRFTTQECAASGARVANVGATTTIYIITNPHANCVSISHTVSQFKWRNSRTSSSIHDMCAHPAHIKLVTSVHDTSHIFMRCSTYTQNVDMSPLNMRKHVVSTRPTRGVIVGILACFQLCILVSASIPALKIHNHDRFLVIIITTDDA